LQRSHARLASAPFMIRFPLLVSCSLLVFGTACERHPVNGAPPMRAHGAGDKDHHPKPGEAAKHPQPEKPATPDKPGEAPKFFPEKK